ncbi:hypothetical protein [Lactococcus lactis]|uniref:hypothetical protein n=1 Tax=Lactococcus lactis TaxID=1358 RepID=UPI00223C0A2E|nr:hypothetical protein [Lactococcus lactis]
MVAYQKKEKLSPYYFETVKREERNCLNELKFVRISKITQSKQTDSLYFFFKLPSGEQWTLSIRTHPPQHIAGNIIFIYINKYEKLSNFTLDIQNRVIRLYNAYARKLGIKEKDYVKLSQFKSKK